MERATDCRGAVWGEQQRVAIARAFVNRPMILIADEPTGNLDPATSVGIMKLLDRINRADTTVLMATHDSTIVDQMRKRVIELMTVKSSEIRAEACTATSESCAMNKEPEGVVRSRAT